MPNTLRATLPGAASVIRNTANETITIVKQHEQQPPDDKLGHDQRSFV